MALAYGLICIIIWAEAFLANNHIITLIVIIKFICSLIHMKREIPDIFSEKIQLFIEQIRNIRITVGCSFGRNNQFNKKAILHSLMASVMVCWIWQIGFIKKPKQSQQFSGVSYKTRKERYLFFPNFIHWCIIKLPGDIERARFIYSKCDYIHKYPTLNKMGNYPKAGVLHKKGYIRKRIFLVKTVLFHTKYFKYRHGETDCFITFEVTGFVWEIRYKKY